MGGIASVFYCAVAREGVKRCLIVSNVSVGNMLPTSYRLVGLF